MGIPVGATMDWHKHFPNTPPLDPEWMEMNGQMCNDPASPYYGQTLDNPNGEGRVFRGGPVSGVLQDDALQGFKVKVNSGSGAGTGEGKLVRGTGNGEDIQRYASTLVNDGVNGAPRVANETRMKNMSMVKIIKIKNEAGIGDAATLQGLPAAAFEPAFSKHTAHNKNFGAVAGTTAEGNHAHGGTPVGDADTLDGKHASELALEDSDSWHRVGSAGNPAYGNRWHAAGSTDYENVLFKKKSGFGLIMGSVIKEYNQETENGVFTLPEEYRPSADVYAGYAHYTCGTEDDNGYFLIRSDGQVRYYGHGPAADAQFWLSIIYPLG